MCVSELAKNLNKPFITLWSWQLDANGKLEKRFESYSADTISNEFRQQFNSEYGEAFFKVMTGAEIIAQDRINPPARIARTIRF